MKTLTKMFTLCCWCILTLSFLFSAGTTEEKLQLERDLKQQNQNTKLSIDELEVPIQECAVEVEAHMEEPNLDFWDEECEGHPTNSHCKVYDD